MFSVGLHKVHDVCWKVDGAGEIIILMQISQIQKDKYFYSHVQNSDLRHRWGMKIDTKREVGEERMKEG